MALLPLLLLGLALVSQPSASWALRLRGLQAAANPVAASPSPTAEAYLDGLFADYSDARASLCKNSFTKKSRVAVVYMCYERAEIINASLSALLRSEGLESYDLFISQDGGSSYTLDVAIPSTVNSLYIRHPANLCTGLHHYFVKSFAFDIMGYEALIVVEEDNIVHPQALQVLEGMLNMSASDPQVGLVSITDMDNSLLVDEERYNSAVLRTEVELGHLWVYGLDAKRYGVVRTHLRDYYAVIKGADYRTKDRPPLSDKIGSLFRSKGVQASVPLSQDSFFVHMLQKEGFNRRLTTLVRLFQPVGNVGLHFRENAAAFYALFGRGMFEGRITQPLWEITEDADDLAELARVCKQRLDVVYEHYLGRPADIGAVRDTVTRLLSGKANAVELVRNIQGSAEHHRRMKAWVAEKGSRRMKARSLV